MTSTQTFYDDSLGSWTKAVNDGTTIQISSAPGGEAGIEVVSVKTSRAAFSAGGKLFAPLRVDLP